MRYLLFIAGLGGLLYGIDVGIIAGALPYLQQTSPYTASQLSLVVAAVLLGSVISSLFAGSLTELFGRKWMLFAAGAMFVVSVPTICLSQSYTLLIAGRVLQGMSGGLIGVVVPLYLAECLPAAKRGKGTAIFQWMLTVGLVAAALVGLGVAKHVDGVQLAARHLVGEPDQSAAIFAAKDTAWRLIFWISIFPGLVFIAGVPGLAESPRWLYRRGKKDLARAALLRSRSEAVADLELREMEEASLAGKATGSNGHAADNDRLLSRKYVVPFVLACVILACNQATGINSILAYIVTILNQAGLPGSVANQGDVIVKIINCLMTIVAILLVDRKGRKFLLTIGAGGMVLSLAMVGILFLATERGYVDCKDYFQAKVQSDGLGNITFDQTTMQSAIAGTRSAGSAASDRPMQLILVYAYGPYGNVLTRRTDDVQSSPIEIARKSTVPENPVVGFFSNPFAKLSVGQVAPLTITKALIGPTPNAAYGWLVAIGLFVFMAVYSVGPGVCVWLALSELMPTRIRSNGMSIALFLNTLVSTIIAAVFLPIVGNYGYSTMFFFWAGCTVVYFITAAFFLPETKGKTLEEIEAHFQGNKSRQAS